MTAPANCKGSNGGAQRTGPARRILACAVIAGSLTLAGTSRIQAQSTPPMAIKVPPVVTAQAAGQTAFPIRVEPADALPRNSFVRVRGLPPMAALSDGYVIGPGSWAIPIAALAELKISLPSGANGKSEIAVLLVAVDGAVLVETKSVLMVAAPGAAATAPSPERSLNPPVGATMLRAGVPIDLGPAKQEPGPAAAPVVPRSTPQERERFMRLLTKGNEQLDQGNIAAARLFYERAADGGLPEAAMALASTFDATELSHHQVRGIPPDKKQARRWYERARELGAAGAEERLRRLGSN